MTNLDVAQVDISSAEVVQTPDGQTLPANQWAKKLGVQFTPSLVFFDQSGKEVFRTEAYLKTFHVHGVMDYVVSDAYRHQPNFQRFLQRRNEELQARGFAVDLME
jgi:thioredoxin-related protein